VFLKKGHLTSECCHKFDDSFVPDERYVGAAFFPYAADSSWYLDTGATDHVTSELEKLAMRKKYKGKDQILGADGTNLKISYIGHSVVNGC
jgi:hypothetical protein